MTSDFLNEILSSRKFWYVDLALFVIFGAWLGYNLQQSADSGMSSVEALSRTAFLGAACYVFALFATFAGQAILPWRAYWVGGAVLGSLLFSLVWDALFVLNSLVDRSGLEVIKEHFGFLATRFIVLTVAFSIPVLVLLFVIRCLGLLLASRNRR